MEPGTKAARGVFRAHTRPISPKSLRTLAIWLLPVLALALTVLPHSVQLATAARGAIASVAVSVLMEPANTMAQSCPPGAFASDVASVCGPTSASTFGRRRALDLAFLSRTREAIEVAVAAPRRSLRALTDLGSPRGEKEEPWRIRRTWRL
jgi:hypothetical protein